MRTRRRFARRGCLTSKFFSPEFRIRNGGRWRQAAAGLAIAIACAAAEAQAATPQLAISCGALGIELQLCREGAAAWSRKSGIAVKIVSTPRSASERLALYQQLLAFRAPDIDVFQIDVVWPGILGPHFIDLKPYSHGDESAHFEAIVENNTVDGRLVALPWFADAGLLYYRKDLLERHAAAVPQTWQQLTATSHQIMQAERVAGNERMWGFVWQGKAYEGLTCNALEWIDSFGGGTILDEAGAITINNPQAREALAIAAGWVGKISPPGILNYAEEEARGVFQPGHAVFMRNWPYAWSLGNADDSPVKGLIGVTVLPRGDGTAAQHSGTLGGQQLAVSRYSRYPAQAAALVLYLTSAAEQKRRAITGSFYPSRPALYQDREILAAAPFFAQLLPVLDSAVARPSRVTGTRYNKVSNAFWEATHAVLSGRLPPTAALDELERDLKRIRRTGW